KGNNLYITGYFDEICDFNPDNGGFELFTSFRTTFVAKFNEGFVSLPNNFDHSNIVLFPNPCDEFIEITYNKEIKQFKMYSLLGQEIKNYKLSGNRIDTSKLQAGTYVIRFEVNGKTISGRFTKL